MYGSGSFAKRSSKTNNNYLRILPGMIACLMIGYFLGSSTTDLNSTVDKTNDWFEQKNHLAREIQWKLFRDLVAKAIRNQPFQKRSSGYCEQKNWKTWEKINCRSNTGATMLLIPHLQQLMDLLRNEIFAKQIEGDIVECGVWQGGASIAMGLTRNYWQENQRTLWLFDSFAGHPEYSSAKDADMNGFRGSESNYLAVSLEIVQANVAAFGVGDNAEYVKGYFGNTMPIQRGNIESIAVLRLDADSFTSTTTILENLYDKVAIGGLVIIDDYYDYKSCREAVDDFRAKRGITEEIHNPIGRKTRPHWIKEVSGELHR